MKELDPIWGACTQHTPTQIHQCRGYVLEQKGVTLDQLILVKVIDKTVVDPGFSIGWRGPLMWVLFGKNVCENEIIGSHNGGHVPSMPPRSANAR